MEHVGGFGTSVTILAMKTFPVGFTVEKFADDVSPIDFGETQIADHEFMVDGRIFSFETGAAISVKIGVIPGTDDDENLSILLNANKSVLRMGGIPDLCFMTINYPFQAPIVLNNGYLRVGKFGTSIAETGRGKGKVYEFVFSEGTNMSAVGLSQAAAGAVLSFFGS